MTFRDKRTRFALHGALIFVLLACACTSDSARQIHLTILHTNDRHGHILPFSYPDPQDSTSTIAKLSERRDIGGLARVGTLVAQVREETNGNCLVLDAGDILDGTPFSTQYHGLADIAVMNAIGYDAMTAGNHEFNLPIDSFWEMVDLAEFPILSANARRIEDAAPILPEYRIFDFDGLRVGLFGVTTTSAAGYPACRDRIEFEDPIATSRRMVSVLEGEEVDLILALSHLGFNSDLAMADSVPEIDLIIGGHSHTRLEMPRVVHHATDRGIDKKTLVCQAFQWAGEVGRLDLEFEESDGGRFAWIDSDARLIPVTGEIAEDPSIRTLVDSLLAPMLPIYGVEIGRATSDFPNSGFERPTANLVADAMREATGVDVALQNLGGVRSSLFAGPIRFWELTSMLPFGNQICVMQVRGARLLEALEGDQERYGLSGMRATWKGGRLVDATIAGEPLRAEETYSLATNSFIARNQFSDIEPQQILDQLVRDAVIDYIQARGRIEPIVDGRCRRLPGEEEE